ncbi:MULTISPECIES: nucleotidyltransferase family protein [unclassified Rathayibacter]|uniref:nucleotidyltransferase family protein n=1 Tax=unclassified Rathayibacter TaxID=2609250 RepID=UPI00188C909B|nr:MULTISPECIES: nucleotidyltransferase domain-containing protein [unclassified Rathayibacter]MBF4462925.1 nucleotidyltransferase domain-containing protein [Rathayibacter sp. VKM Ac-2879]MBF4504339.1 nucleotidyltransferase domain-containing protein [Rathayibacter sp. VKM Ac-2878]
MSSLTVNHAPRRTTAPTLDAIRARRAELLALAARSGITGVSVFGSVARGQATDASDIDLVVDAEANISYFSLAAFALEAESLLGHPVDVIFRSGLRDIRDDSILADEVSL